ncbi:vWA domain-containing protein [Megamonas sp.]
MENNALIRLQDLVDNPTTRVPICICLDTSASMLVVESGTYEKTGETVYEDGRTWNIVSGGETRLNELQKGLQLFFDAITGDEVAKYAAEICVVQFNGDAECLLDFGSIERQQVPQLKAKGDTHMGEAVNLALDLLEKRKNEYKDKGVDYYQPWLVILTDGENNGSQDSWQRAIDRVGNMVKSKKLTVFPIGIGKEANMSSLGKLSPNRSPLRLQGLKFAEFFEWLSKSVSKTSQSVPGELVALDTEGIKGWGTL